ncbi:MAG TPA: DUF4304 domain-containing protein [Verrucomicrobiales bacterium]|nr:DUF4304 domain-containing protein [Verrucomicrobiales bacterium]
MNERDQFHAQVKRLLKPVLVAEGFQASGATYRRALGEVIHVLTLQGSLHGGQCCVCLGIHLTFLPPAGSANACDPTKITEPECEFRTRLAPSGETDYWWSYGLTGEAARSSVESILRLYREVGEPYFNRFSKFPNDFIHVTPALLATDSSLPFPGRSTEVRRALALSRIALHAGRVSDAREFAEFGLARVGAAAALKKEFRKILLST